jgi:tetratricopeptide (TPR) repeat protein
MWYLIVPPIIVVVSLSFVLWYLSRKGADPLVAAKVSRLEGEAGQKVSFLRTKTYFLRLLEKTAYRFKVTSLKAHNALHNLTHSLKESQRRFQAKSVAPEPSEKITEQTGAAEPKSYIGRADDSRSFLKRYKETKEKVKEEVVSSQTEKEITVEQDTFSIPAIVPESPLSARPMVSETVTHPEKERTVTREQSLREAELIASISANPKDFTVYEQLGDYYLEIGNVKDAKECYRQVLKLSPVQRMARIKIRRLEKILSQEAE